MAPLSAGNVIAQQLGTALQKRGYLVDERVGQSRFRCDLAVRSKNDPYYQLGILLDSESHYANPNLVERYFTQPSILKAFGMKPIGTYASAKSMSPLRGCWSRLRCVAS